jgi:hypothetical protein
VTLSVHTTRLLILIALSLCSETLAAETTRYVVAGTVVDSSTAQPLAGISVSLAPDRTGGHSQTVHTSHDGGFRFAAVPGGKYVLSGSGPGYRPQGLDQHRYYFTGLAVGPDLDTSKVVFRLQPDASIRGQVLDDQNEPVRNATVQLFTVDDSDGIRRTVATTNVGTDDQGYYHFPHLEPGTYYVAVSARPWYAQYSPQRSDRSQPMQLLDGDTARAHSEAAQLDVAYPLTFYPDTDDSAQASAITLHAGERATADVVMRAVPAAHLRIRSGTTSEHSSVPRIMQRVFDDYLVPVLASQGFGYSQGMYEFAGLAPGHYVLEMPGSNPGDAGSKAGWFREVDLSGDVEVSSDESLPMANVAGAVVYQGAAPPAESMYLELHSSSSGDGWTGQISHKGLFGLKDNEIRPGTYEIKLYGASGWFVNGITAQNAKVQGMQVTIASGASVRLICNAIRAVSSLRGVVQVGDQPLAGAMVLLVPDDRAHISQRYRRDQSDSDGSFTLREVLPGHYTAIAIQNGWNLEWENPQVLKPYLAKGEKITVSTSQNASLKIQAQ